MTFKSKLIPGWYQVGFWKKCKITIMGYGVFTLKCKKNKENT